MERTLNTEQLLFTDLIGNLQVMDDLVFMPRLKSMRRLKSLGEAKKRMGILSSSVLSGKSVITHGDIFGREYLFFYGDDGVYDHRRVYTNKIDKLHFMSYVNAKIGVFLSREIPALVQTEKDVRSMLETEEGKKASPRVLVILEGHRFKRGVKPVARRLFRIFDELEAVLFIGPHFFELEKKERAMLLCSGLT